MADYGVLDSGQDDDEESAADELANALAARRQRLATVQAMAQANPNGSLGAILSNIGVGLGATVAGRDAGSAVRDNMNSISASSKNSAKLTALDDNSDMKGLLALAKLRQAELAPIKDPVGVQTLKNTGALDLQKLKNQGAVDTTGAKGKSALDVQGLKNSGAMDVEDSRAETKQQMNDIMDKLGELKDATTKRGQDLGDQHFAAGLEYKYNALRQRLDELDRNNVAKSAIADAGNASRESIASAGNASKETIASQGNQTKQSIADSGNDTRQGIAEGNNQTSKDVAGINAGAKTKVADINAASKGAANADGSGRNGPVARDRLQLQANQKYESTMHNTESQLYAANRVNTLISGIRAGDLVGTSQLKSDLSGALASMLNNGKSATVYGMSHQDFNSAYGDVEKAYGYLSGSTPGTITDDQLSQLGKDVAALKKEYMLQHQVQYNSFSKGLPDSVVPKLNDRFNYFRNSIVDQQPQPRAQSSQNTVIPYAPGQGPSSSAPLDVSKLTREQKLKILRGQ